MAATNSDIIRELRGNWQVLLVAFVCLLFAFSAPAFFVPFLYPEVIREFGWSREQAVLLASSKYLTGSIVAIVVGRFIDVIGVRLVLITVSALGGFALLSLLWTSGLTGYYLAGVMLGFSGSGTMVAIKVLVSRTFHAAQGTAMGIALLSTSLGAIMVPFAATWLMSVYGWRIGSALLSAGVWFIALPLMIFYLTEKTFDDRSAASGRDSVPAAIDWSVVREFAASRSFWLIFIAVFCAGFVDQSLIQHQVLYLGEDLQLSAIVVATVVSATGIIAFITRPLVGSLFDRKSTRGVALGYLVLGAACIIALGAANPLLLALFVVFRAVGHSAVLLDTLVLAKHRFGLTHIGILIGVYTAAVNIGFAVGPPVVARLYMLTGSYVVPFLACAGVGLLAAAVLLPIKPVYWLQSRTGDK